MTTQTPTDPNRATAPQKIRRVEVYWHTVTYKTVAVYVLLLAAIVFSALYIAVPDWSSKVIAMVNKAAGNPGKDSGDAVDPDKRGAKFVNLDGKVHVKKVNSVQWVEADYRTTLDKGDLVQTASDGAARITFADGTFYTVKADTLVTIEENSTDISRPTNIAVRINTGQVDLRTPNWSSSASRASVSVEDTVAQLRSNSGAAVKSDPQSKESEVVVSSGSAEVKRGAEKIELAPWQKVTIPSGGPIQRSDVLAPPEPAEPVNLTPIIAEYPKFASIHFEWKPVPNAASYTLRISTTAMFTKTVKEAKVTSGNSVDISGLETGDYFWNVFATDARKQNSQVSESFKFTLVAQGKAQEMLLQIEGTQIHGRVVEVYGHTEPGATLIVNGQPVPNIGPDGVFRYFTEPLEPGQHTIVIIGQNRRGGTAKQQVSIVVPK